MTTAMSDSPAANPPGVIRSMVSGKDNVSVDVIRVSALCVVLGLVGFTGWNMWQGRPFDPMAYCGAAAVLFPAVTAALWGKAKTEPGGG